MIVTRSKMCNIWVHYTVYSILKYVSRWFRAKIRLDCNIRRPLNCNVAGQDAIVLAVTQRFCLLCIVHAFTLRRSQRDDNCYY
jgi:hypothetical protein